MKKFQECSICHRSFKTGIQIPVVDYYDKRSKMKGKWYVAKKREKVLICTKCKNTLFALVRNSLAFKTSDIIDE